MKNLALSFKTNIFLSKFIACLVFFCIVMTSTNIVNNFSEPILVDDTIQISAETIMVQFFYISALPANFISKLFLSKQADPISNKKANEQDKNKAESNSSKASVGFSFLPAQTDFSKVLELKKVIATGGILAFVKVVKNSSVFSTVSKLFYCCCNKFNLSIIMMLLLAISLTRRNIGNDGIVIINIENNKLARLI